MSPIGVRKFAVEQINIIDITGILLTNGIEFGLVPPFEICHRVFAVFVNDFIWIRSAGQFIADAENAETSYSHHIEHCIVNVFEQSDDIG